MNHKRRILRRCAAVAGGLLVIAWMALLVYFPGRQSLLAMILASGLGITGLQARVDALEDKAIKGEPFADADKAFLRDLYTCFAKGARLTCVLRQSAQLMDRYLSGSGELLRLKPRIFQCFLLPNARSLLQGPRYCLHMDDGLGEHLTQIGLAKPFLVFSEWEERIFHNSTPGQ